MKILLIINVKPVLKNGQSCPMSHSIYTTVLESLKEMPPNSNVLDYSISAATGIKNKKKHVWGLAFYLPFGLYPGPVFSLFCFLLLFIFLFYFLWPISNLYSPAIVILIETPVEECLFASKLETEEKTEIKM